MEQRNCPLYWAQGEVTGEEREEEEEEEKGAGREGELEEDEIKHGDAIQQIFRASIFFRQQ